MSDGARFRRSQFQVVARDESVVLKRGVIQIRIVGDAAMRVVEELLTCEGEQSVDDFAGRFAAPDRRAVVDLIDALLARGFLVPADGRRDQVDDDARLDTFFWQFGLTSQDVRSAVRDTAVTVAGVNVLSGALVRHLSAAGFDRIDVVDVPVLRNPDFDPSVFGATTRVQSLAGWDPHGLVRERAVVVGCSDFGSHALFRELGRTCVTSGLRFMPVVLQDILGFAGPLVIPRETACVECLLLRQNANLPDTDLARAWENDPAAARISAAMHPVFASALGAVAAVELLKFVALIPRWRVGELIELNLLASTMQSRPVLKVPRCRVCSAVEVTARTAVEHVSALQL